MVIFMSLQTPEVPYLLQAPEEPKQHREEPGAGGRPPWQRFQGASVAHDATGRRTLMRYDLPIYIKVTPSSRQKEFLTGADLIPAGTPAKTLQRCKHQERLGLQL